MSHTWNEYNVTSQLYLNPKKKKKSTRSILCSQWWRFVLSLPLQKQRASEGFKIRWSIYEQLSVDKNPSNHSSGHFYPFLAESDTPKRFLLALGQPRKKKCPMCWMVSPWRLWLPACLFPATWTPGPWTAECGQARRAVQRRLGTPDASRQSANTQDPRRRLW